MSISLSVFLFGSPDNSPDSRERSALGVWRCWAFPSNGLQIVVSINRWPKHRSQHTAVLLIGSPKKEPLIIRNPQISLGKLCCFLARSQAANYTVLAPRSWNASWPPPELVVCSPVPTCNLRCTAATKLWSSTGGFLPKGL